MGTSKLLNRTEYRDVQIQIAKRNVDFGLFLVDEKLLLELKICLPPKLAPMGHSSFYPGGMGMALCLICQEQSSPRCPNC